MRNRFVAIGSIALLILVVLAGCAQPAAVTTTPATSQPPATSPTTTAAPPTTPAQAGQYGQLKLALSTLGMENFDPNAVSQTTVTALTAEIFDWLVTSTGKEIVPEVAEKWEMAPDGLSYLLTIRKGIKFQNGEDLKADDVKFSIDRYLSKESYYSYLRDITDRAEVVDEYTIRVYTKGTQPGWLGYAGAEANSSQGLISPKDYIEKNGVAFFARNPVGSGSWKFVRHVPGDMVEYEAVAKHWQNTPEFKSLRIILMPEETTRLATLKTGGVDIIDVGIESAAELEAAGFQTPTLSHLNTSFRFYGAYDPRAAGMPAADIRVRKALTLAIDRDEILKTLFMGKAKPSFVPALTENARDIDPAYWQDYASKVYRYDPEEARKLLKEAGYPDGFNIKLYSYTMGGAPFLPKLCEVMQGYWAKVGVKAQIIPTDWGSFTRIRAVGSGPDRGPAAELVGNISLGAQSERADGVKNLITSFRSGGTYSYLGKAMPEVDKALDSYQNEMSEAKRREYVATAIKLVTDTYTVNSIGNIPEVTALSPAVEIKFPPMSSAVTFYTDVAKHRK